MTSPSLLEQPIAARGRQSASPAPRPSQGRLKRFGLPVLLFLATMLSTTAVGMRYMLDFRQGRAPLSSDTDILPFTWMAQHLNLLGSGLPFSLTLIGILLAHEFGHYFACRFYGVRSSLPYLLPAPSLSGTFGAVIRLQSVIRSRAALIAIGASGPIAGFLVALVSVTWGLALSHYASRPLLQHVQPPLVILAIHSLLDQATGNPHPLELIVPHPVLIASWIGLLITALNLIPAGQLDGGHILYALSPATHRWTTRLVIAALFLLGLLYWAGWILWAIILILPGMHHPSIPSAFAMERWQYWLVPICLLLLIFCGTLEPFTGYGLIEILRDLPFHSN
jgi:membrane-associated protease RseP (regulator of RpoE activity)